MVLEAAHAADPAIDAAMILLEPVVKVGAGAMPDPLAQHGADRPWIEVVAPHCDLIRLEAHSCFSRAKEGLLPGLSEQSLSIFPVPKRRRPPWRRMGSGHQALIFAAFM